jgi:DNA-binding response OmpR family regulator
MFGMRILVAEDERFLADLVAEGLREEAMAVDVAYDGATALERLAVNDYDVLVLDRDLPQVLLNRCSANTSCALHQVRNSSICWIW